MIKDLPEWAELAFAAQCAAAGVRPHPPRKDTGWDYYLEFPPGDHPGPADTHPPAKIAYAQVKSKTRGKATCRLSLSNALKAAQSPQPWFLVLFVIEDDP